MAGACRHWRDASSIFEQLAARNELSPFDRKNSLAMIWGQLAQYCR
jgi:hypothetical protein